ncbi:MAG: lamin tail domain-containing protein [Bacteroidota bacterium]
MKRLLLSALVVACFVNMSAQTDLIISEYVEGWSTNKALEIYNPTSSPIFMGDYRLVRYSNGSNVPPADDAWTVVLPEENLEPYHSYVIVLDKRDPEGVDQEAPVWAQLAQRADVFLCANYDVSWTMYFNGDDCVTLEKSAGANWDFVDIFARYGAPRPAAAPVLPGSSTTAQAWTNIAPYFDGQGVALTADHTLVRKSSVSNGVKNNPTLFNPLAEYDSLPANTFDHLGWHKYDNAPSNNTPVINNTTLKFGVSPTATNGTVIATISASDADSDPLKYYLDYGNFIYIENVRYEPFSLDKSTGVLSLVDEAGLAPEVLDTFYLKLTVTDGFSQAGPVTVMLIVSDNVATGNVLSRTASIYPNPVTEGTFQISDSKAFRSYELVNMAGQVIEKEVLSQPVFNRSITVPSESGVLMLKLSYEDGSASVYQLVVY